MSYWFAGIEVDVPFGPAAGAINGPSKDLLLKQAHEVLLSPVGAAWVGSFTREPSEGNARHGRTYYHKPSTGETVNSMGLPNIGIAQAEKLMPGLARMAANLGKVLVASVSPAKGEDPVRVLPELVARMFEAGAQAVEANYSCPNKITDDGNREPILGYDPIAVSAVRHAILQRIGEHQIFIEKWPPYEGEKELIGNKMAHAILEFSGVKYISLPNTRPNQLIMDEAGSYALDVPGHTGGMSGPATREMGRDQLRFMRSLLPQYIGIVSCSGVDNGMEVFHRVEHLGADFTAGVAIYFNNEEKGTGYGQTSVRIAEEFADMLSGS